MPVTRIDREAVPYVRPAYEPDTRTLLQLMQMAGQSQVRAAAQRGDTRAQGLMTLGQVISQGLSGMRQGKEREQAQAFAQQQYQNEQQHKGFQDQLSLAQFEALQEERAAARQAREQAATTAADASAYKRGGDVAGEVGYGPMSEPQMESVMQGPAAGRARYSFGPGTADGPELMPTREQQQGIDTRKSIEAMGGTLGPNGQVVMPPKPETPSNPTEWSVLMQAAGGDPRKALEVRRQQRPVGSSEPRPLTQTAEAAIINRLSNQWTAANKPIRDLDRQVQLMHTGMEAVNRGDLAQGAQMVLVTFQKILDPPSVVRESEFMRSAAGQSLMNRVKGAAERLTKGGAGITAPELQKFAALAQEAANAQRKASGIDGIKSRLGRTADRYNIPQELIFEDEGAVTPPPAARPYLSNDPNGGEPIQTGTGKPKG